MRCRTLKCRLVPPVQFFSSPFRHDSVGLSIYIYTHFAHMYVHSPYTRIYAHIRAVLFGLPVAGAISLASTHTRCSHAATYSMQMTTNASQIHRSPSNNQHKTIMIFFKFYSKKIYPNIFFILIRLTCYPY